MRMKPIILFALIALGTSSCAVVGGLATIAPGEAVVAREAGYDSYFEQGLDLLASQFCAKPRDPMTGDCE